MAIVLVVVVVLWLVVLAPVVLDLLKRVVGKRFSHISASAESLLSNKVAYLPGIADDAAPGEKLSLLVGMDTSRAFQREWARRRRRAVMWTLTGMSVVSLVAFFIISPGPFAFAWSGSLLAAHVVSDVLLGSYVIALARRQRRIQERRVQVTTVRRPARPEVGSFQPRVEPIRLVSSAGGRS